MKPNELSLWDVIYEAVQDENVREAIRIINETDSQTNESNRVLRG